MWFPPSLLRFPTKWHSYRLGQCAQYNMSPSSVNIKVQCPQYFGKKNPKGFILVRLPVFGSIIDIPHPVNRITTPGNHKPYLPHTSSQKSSRPKRMKSGETSLLCWLMLSIKTEMYIPGIFTAGKIGQCYHSTYHTQQSYHSTYHTKQCSVS